MIRSKSLRSPEATLDTSVTPVTVPPNASPPTPSRPSRTLKLKDRVKSLFNDTSKEAKTPTAADKPKIIDF